MNSPISLKEGLTDDAKILFEQMNANQLKVAATVQTSSEGIIQAITDSSSTMVTRLDRLINIIKENGIGTGGGNNGGTDPKPGEVVEDLTNLKSETLIITNDTLTESYDGTTSTFLTNYAPIIYGTFVLKANDTVVPVSDYEVSYTTGLITILNKLPYKTMKLVASHNHEIVNVADQPLTVFSAETFTYKAPYTNIIKEGITLNTSKGQGVVVESVNSREGKITVSEANFDTTATASMKVIVPLAYSRLVGTGTTGTQVTHGFTENYASLFTALNNTEGDNGEYAVNNGSKTTTLINTGLETLNIDYAIIHDTTGRIYVGDSNYSGTSGITVSHNLGTENIKTFVITNNATSGLIGETWVSNKTEYDFKVHNSGEDVTSPFKYVVIKNSVGTETGSGTFSAEGTRIEHNLALGTDYSVLIQPTSNPEGYLGDVWVDVASNSFTVNITGTAIGTFDYLIIEN